MIHPYKDLPDRQFWKKAEGLADPDQLDPVTKPAFRISRTDRIVTAGSCFAQHVARHLTKAGFCHHITERAHPVVPPVLAEQHNYGMFAARYGNIYTPRQLRQLIERAFGAFQPRAEAWPARGGRGVVDPFRPQIQPGGFVDATELAADRAQHLSATRQAFEEMDVFVFTLGLTEAWVDTEDGAVFPLAPGVAGGAYDAREVAFRNFDCETVTSDLEIAIKMLRSIRRDLRVILTVSPVPLNATFEDQHVWQATTWSKSVLRVAAESCARRMPDCTYFPSYEIITSPHQRGRYFGPDCREVTPRGVAHVMRLFLQHFTDADGAPPKARAVSQEDAVARHDDEMSRKIELLCDEAAIDNH